MINILVVEDEHLEREAISSILKKEFKNQIGLLMTADNGKQAFTLFQENQIQLVITDINIPKLNGLQLLKKIKKIDDSIKAVILTGYDYFEYAQEAIKIGVDDFLLKPTSHNDICACVGKIITLYEQHKDTVKFADSDHYKEIKSVLESDLVYAILHDDTTQNISKYFSLFQMNAKSAVCFCLYKEKTIFRNLDIIIQEFEQNGYNCFYETYFEYIVVFIFHEAIMTMEHVNTICRKFEEQFIEPYGVSEIKVNTKDFYHAFIEAQNVLESKVSNIKILQKEQERPNTIEFDLQGYIFEIMDGIEHNRVSVASQVAEKLYKYTFRMHNRNPKEIYHQFFTMLKAKMMKDNQLSSYCEIVDNNLETLEHVELTHDVHIYIVCALKSIVIPIIETRQKKLNKLIVSAFSYIEKNYYRAIGLIDLSTYLDVTPQYISTLLSQYNQNNFTNILAEYRIMKAKELLDSNKKIKEVACLVGFQNANYFAKTFKKVTGLTPKEYKHMKVFTNYAGQ